MYLTSVAKVFVGRIVILLALLVYTPAFGQVKDDNYGTGGSRDETGQPFDPGEVILIWTAPGNDGYFGQATGYDIRYLPAFYGPIDTDYEWLIANTVDGEPTPSPAGYTDTMEIGGLDYAAPYYFCIRAYDQANNYSAMSNSPLAVSGAYVDCPYIPGDADGDGLVNIFDIGYIITFLYLDGDPPQPFEAGDVNASGEINIYDITYLLNYLYYGTDDPLCVY